MKTLEHRIGGRFLHVLALSLLLGVTPLVTVQAAAPFIKEAKVVTNSFIEIDWEGSQTIKSAGRSKEDSQLEASYFEVKLNGIVLEQTIPWYWNIVDMPLHGVVVNQNKTTLRLATPLDADQMKSLQNGTSKMTVRISSSRVAGSDYAPADTEIIYPVVYKPYYNKTITSKVGIQVKASEFVHQSTLQDCADIIDKILSAAPENLLTIMRSRNSFAIFGPGEHSYNIPEHRSIFLRDAWRRAEGYGGYLAATSAANVVRNHVSQTHHYPTSYASGYRNESILTHEFGHGIHSAVRGSEASDIQALNAEFNRCYENAKEKGMWPNTYAISNSGEYFATLTVIWFNAMRETEVWGPTYGPVNTRAELYVYDRKAYDFFAKILPAQIEYLNENWLNCPDEFKAGIGDPHPW